LVCLIAVPEYHVVCAPADAHHLLANLARNLLAIHDGDRFPIERNHLGPHLLIEIEGVLSHDTDGLFIPTDGTLNAIVTATHPVKELMKAVLHRGPCCVREKRGSDIDFAFLIGGSDAKYPLGSECRLRPRDIDKQTHASDLEELHAPWISGKSI
jgi:hypothetical protein